MNTKRTQPLGGDSPQRVFPPAQFVGDDGVMVAEWEPGAWIIVQLPDGLRVRCQIVDILDDGTVQVVPDAAEIIMS